MIFTHEILLFIKTKLTKHEFYSDLPQLNAFLRKLILILAEPLLQPHQAQFKNHALI